MKIPATLILASAAFAQAQQEGSVRGRSLASAGGSISGCFSEVSTVQVFGKGAVEMKNLQVGDEILTAEGSYQSVYAFGHLDKATKGNFIQIKTDQSVLEVTAEHLLFVDGKQGAIRADSVRIGDSFEGASVKSIGSFERSGLYAPFTESGTLVVDGVKASSYISLQDTADNVELQNGFQLMSQHEFVHMMMSPFRMMCMGVSSELCQSYNENGMPFFVGYGLQFAEWADTLPVFVQAVLLTAFLFIARGFMLFEAVFGASYGPMMMAGALGTAALLKVSNVRVRANKVKSV